MNFAQLALRFERMPMVKAIVPFAVGILLAEHFTLPLWFLAGAFVLSGAMALVLRSPLCAVAMLLFGGFSVAQLHDTGRTVPYGVYTSYKISVQSIPAERGRYASAQAVVDAWRNPENGKWQAAGDRIMLYTDSLVSLAGGEQILCRGTIRPLEGGAESYRHLMARRGYVGTFWLSERGLTERLPKSHEGLHLKAVERLRQLGLHGDVGAVYRAMVAGDTSGVTPELRQTYSRSGLAHLLAVSGLHTGIVFGLVNLLLWWMPLLRRGHLLRNVVAAAAIWLFVAAAGFPPSAVRAAVMFTMLQFALASGSEYVALNTLAAAAFGMLLWNPAWLGDISFQLSYIAVAAILVWGVPLCRLLRTRWKLLNVVVDALAISLVASLATTPLVSHTFGTVPLAGLLANPPAILLASVIVLGGCVWMILPVGFLAPMFGWVLSKAAYGVNLLAQTAASFPGGSVQYTLSAYAADAIYLVFIVATLATWSCKPKKSVHLPA